ncbi:hypothetical protein QAD02_007195 [Eretmocerus hayati]|uniref:Uncharacterized protein n=1 Tax=Eretmocerus hayati TaxID=131215 RepID=A0ACC2N3J9_9HYME|nr:hypothetical protein QAD02_007195 [Eretmocerus hayati]
MPRAARRRNIVPEEPAEPHAVHQPGHPAAALTTDTTLAPRPRRPGRPPATLATDSTAVSTRRQLGRLTATVAALRPRGRGRSAAILAANPTGTSRPQGHGRSPDAEVAAAIGSRQPGRPTAVSRAEPATVPGPPRRPGRPAAVPGIMPAASLMPRHPGRPSTMALDGPATALAPRPGSTVPASAASHSAHSSSSAANAGASNRRRQPVRRDGRNERSTSTSASVQRPSKRPRISTNEQNGRSSPNNVNDQFQDEESMSDGSIVDNDLENQVEPVQVPLANSTNFHADSSRIMLLLMIIILRIQVLMRLIVWPIF